MAEFDDNEELAALSRWWSKNGTAAIAGVLIGVLVIGGWYGWNWYSNRQDARAADMFAQVQHGIATNNVTGGVKNIVNKLENNYRATPYAGAAALSMAAYYTRQNQLDQAASALDWAMNNADGKGLRQIATVRKARVLWAQKHTQQAMTLVNKHHPPAFDALYATLAGDMQAAEGHRQAAHRAYQKALAKLPEDAMRRTLNKALPGLPDQGPRQMLQQKLEQTAPASAASDGSSASNKSHL